MSQKIGPLNGEALRARSNLANTIRVFGKDSPEAADAYRAFDIARAVSHLEKLGNLTDDEQAQLTAALTGQK